MYYELGKQYIYKFKARSSTPTLFRHVLTVDAPPSLEHLKYTLSPWALFYQYNQLL